MMDLSAQVLFDILYLRFADTDMKKTSSPGTSASGDQRSPHSIKYLFIGAMSPSRLYYLVRILQATSRKDAGSTSTVFLGLDAGSDKHILSLANLDLVSFYSLLLYNSSKQFVSRLWLSQRFKPFTISLLTKKISLQQVLTKITGSFCFLLVSSNCYSTGHSPPPEWPCTVPQVGGTSAPSVASEGDLKVPCSDLDTQKITQTCLAD
jgi:hypothetical protein